MNGRIPAMKEKTLRYAGHIACIKQLQQTGAPWRPGTWKPGDDVDEFTILEINIDASAGGAGKKLSFTLMAAWDQESGMSSISRTTGSPAQPSRGVFLTALARAQASLHRPASAKRMHV
jgi:hypothetical protein